jgi:HEAT repeat protein
VLDRGFLILAVAAGILLVTSFSFAILALTLRLANDFKSRRWVRLTKRWEPAMLEVLGGAVPPEAIFDRVEDEDGLYFLTFLLGYARRLRGDEQDMVCVMARPYLPRVLPRLQRGTAESRGNAVLMLARMGMPTYSDAVAGALEDESPVVAMIAARSLFRPGHEAYFQAVLEHLPRFTGWSRSFLAGMVAGGGAGAAPLLREILRDPTERPLVRAVASDALRELNDLDSVPLVLHLLADETDRELVAGCLRILKHLGHREHVPAVRMMAASRDPVIRATAVSALGALGGKPEIPLLQEKLDDPSFWVSLEAARGLLALGDRATLERLAESRGPWSTLASQVLSE